MEEKVTDLIYSARSLCEALRDRTDLFDYDDDLKDYIEDVEAALEALADFGEDD